MLLTTPSERFDGIILVLYYTSTIGNRLGSDIPIDMFSQAIYDTECVTQTLNKCVHVKATICLLEMDFVSLVT